jgi:microcystin-dependent protein
MGEPLLGQLALVPYNFAPQGWARCDGTILPIQSNTALFSLLGTQFGGDGRTTFALPKLEAPAENLHWVIALMGIYPSRY